MRPAPARRVVVLISGRGSNMQRLVEHSRAAGAPYEVVAVLSDQAAAPGLALARDLGCTARWLGAGGYADRPTYDAALADAIESHAPDLVVLAAQETAHGATVHFVTTELDAGPAVLQGRLDVGPDDDESSLRRRVQGIEHRIYPAAVEWFCSGRLEQRDGRAWRDGNWLREPVQWGESGGATS